MTMLIAEHINRKKKMSEPEEVDDNSDDTYIIGSIVEVHTAIDEVHR